MLYRRYFLPLQLSKDNHLVAKYNNVQGKHYRQPIPTGLNGEYFGIEQPPGY